MVIFSLEERRTWKASVFNTLKPFTGSKFCRKRSSREQFTCGELKIHVVYFQNVHNVFLKFDMRFYLDDVRSKTLLLASRRWGFQPKNCFMLVYQISLHFEIQITYYKNIIWVNGHFVQQKRSGNPHYFFFQIPIKSLFIQKFEENWWF